MTDDDHPIIGAAEKILAETQDGIEARRERVLSTAEQRRLCLAYIALAEARKGGPLTDEDLVSIAPDVTFIINWAIKTRLAQTALELALKGLVMLDWDRGTNDVRALLTPAGVAVCREGTEPL